MTVTANPQRPFDREASKRRVRYPLQLLHKHIRTYVVLEGLALAFLFLAAWFWAGLLLDYGTFRLFAFDWVQELRDIAPDQRNALWVRLVLLAVFVLALVGLVVTKVGLRWWREFSDPALALVLERRFPRELGDRLITAVELADPEAARRYGFSNALVDKTIQDVEDRLERLPVAEAFDWGRLIRLWILVGAATFGAYLFVGLTSLGVAAAVGEPVSPIEYGWRFHDIATIFSERNFLMRESYWPRRAHLEITRFAHTQDNPSEMRVGRDEQRPDIQVRAVQWVTADRAAPDGWRALRWDDLPSLVEPDLLEHVDVPASWPHWVIDLDDLDPRVPAGLLPASLHLKSAGEVRQAVDDPALKENLVKAGATEAVEDLLNWQRWPIDKLVLQEQRQEVRIPLRQTPGFEPLMKVIERLEELALAPSMSRRLRKLTVPEYVQVNYRGKTIKASEPCTPLADNKFAIGLSNLKESVRFRVQGEDYFTPAKLITLVPPPAVTRLTIDKEEPAYLYHRLQGDDQTLLKGRKQIYRDFAVSITGDLSTIEVPLGTDLLLRAETDRKLKEPVRMRAPAAREAGVSVPDDSVTLDPGGKSFTASFAKVDRPVEFFFEYNDEDNVKGRRRIRIRPIDDQAPEVVNVDLAVVLRKPRFRSEASKSTQGTAADAFLITPDALLPFQGTVRDDHGLTRVGWTHEAEQVDLELVGKSKDRLPTLVLQGNTRTRRAGLVVSALQFGPGGAANRLAGTLYLSWMARLMDADLASTAGQTQGEGFVLMEQFKTTLERRSLEELPITALEQKLREPPTKRERWEHQLKDEAGFDVKRYLPKLKAANPREEGQLHYLLKLGVLATDNNLETGGTSADDQGRAYHGSTSRTKVPFQFLVVSENELLAQIAIEEESLFERLEKVVEKLRYDKTLTDEQLVKLAGDLKESDLSLVSIRLDEIRKSLIDTSSATREVATAYGLILKEMEVNRVARERVDKVAEKIVGPLEQVVDPKAGNNVLTEAFYQRAYEAVEEDALAGKSPKNQKQHLQNVRDAGGQLDILIDRLNAVLIAMNEGILESKLVEALVVIERTQRQNTEAIRVIRLREEQDLISELLKGGKN